MTEFDARIMTLQKRVGALPDGFWGEKSIARCKAHLKSLMPAVNPWPKPTQADLTAFYGKPGDESKLVKIDVFKLEVKYDGAPVKVIRCHQRVAASLLRVLTSLAQTHPEILRRYEGCYNNRPMRTGKLPSLHARGAAIDFDAGRNELFMHWPTVASMPIEVMEAFAREGWKSLGATIGRDAMHFEATS